MLNLTADQAAMLIPAAIVYIFATILMFALLLIYAFDLFEKLGDKILVFLRLGDILCCYVRDPEGRYRAKIEAKRLRNRKHETVTEYSEVK